MIAWRAVCRSRNSSINNTLPPRESTGAQVLADTRDMRYALRTRPHTLHNPLTQSARVVRAHAAHAHIAASFSEKARKPAALARSRDGLSDLHARQVQRASRCITCLIHVSRIPGVTIPADFHNATRAPHRTAPRRVMPQRGSALDRRSYFSARETDHPAFTRPYRSR